MPKVNMFFLNPKRVEEFVAATASLTAFYYLLEANSLADYNCDVGNVTLLRGQYEKYRCSSLSFQTLFEDSNCTLRTPNPDLNCETLQRLASECGWPSKRGAQSSTAESLVSVLLGVTLVCLIVLLYFSTDSESESQMAEREIVEAKKRSKPGCIGCTNGPYYCGWLRSIRAGTCLAAWAAQLGTRIYYGTQLHKSLCQTTAYTTQTGLLYLWPIAMFGTLLAAYTPDNPVPTPIRFGHVAHHKDQNNKIELNSSTDSTLALNPDQP